MECFVLQFLPAFILKNKNQGFGQCCVFFCWDDVNRGIARWYFAFQGALDSRMGSREKDGVGSKAPCFKRSSIF